MNGREMNPENTNNTGNISIPPQGNAKQEKTGKHGRKHGGAREKRFHQLKTRKIVMNTLSFSIVLAGILWLSHFFYRHIRYEITNDAYVDQYVAPISIRVPGFIKEVRFTEHQKVKKGDTLLLLDEREYQIRLEQAQADLLDALADQDIIAAGLGSSQSRVAVEQANIAEAKSRLWQSEQDYHRYAHLYEEASVSKQQYEQARSKYEAALSRHAALQQQEQAAQWSADESRKRQEKAQAGILRMQANLEMAELNLSYTVVTAPYDGYMGRRTLEPGQYVQGGQTLSYIVRQEGKWITANYRETQIAGLEPGQTVRIHVDAFKHRVFHGRISAISQATGSKYALVPTDNAAGNFVKVQQRIPVRIEIEDASPEEMELLRAGMMAVTEVVKKSGPAPKGLQGSPDKPGSGQGTEHPL